MKPLEGRIAIVGGASRGAGRGIAVALGEAGATVYVAARTSKDGPEPPDHIPGTVEKTADEVTARGGRGIAVPADLSDEAQVAALFARVEREQGRLDMVANAAWYTNVVDQWSKPFWELSGLWRDMMQIVDAYWLTGVYAARLMMRQGHGLVVYVTDHAIPDPLAYYGQMMWDVGHHAINRLVLGMSHELKKSKAAVVGLNPGFMRTERVVIHMRQSTDEVRKQFRFDLSETPEYVGRAAAALAADSEVMRKSGQLLWAADLAKEYGFTDVDGRYIPRFNLETPVGEIPAAWLELP
jgi:NAD(P)-dependent dehydrogenase (short-subunit alcohol dehydrogenase family)